MNESLLLPSFPHFNKDKPMNLIIEMKQPPSLIDDLPKRQICVMQHLA